MSTSKRELEIKLELTREQLRRAVSLPLFAGAGRATRATVRTIYFDTPDRALRKAGLSLRLRRSGKTWVQTVKCGNDVSGGVARRLEVEAEAPGPEPRIDVISDKSVRRKMKSAIGKAELAPLFETLVKRTVRTIEEKAGTVIEVAFDEGTVNAGDRREAISEAEIELKSGDAGALLEVAAKMADDAPLRLATSSKSGRGYGIVDASFLPSALLPRKAEPARVFSDQPSVEALRACCRSAADQVVHNWRAVVETDDAEAAHQMRVGLRRLRSALRMFRPMIDDAREHSLQDKLKDLAACVGEVRDLDVLALEVVAPLQARDPDDAGLEALLDSLAHERAGRRTHLRKVLASRQQSLDQLEIALLPDCLDGMLSASGTRRQAEPIDALAARIIDKRWRRVAKRAEHIPQLDVEQRHAMRKDLKALRYAIEFLSPLLSHRDTRKFLSEATRMQDLLGYLSDAALARRIAQLPLVAQSGDVALHRAVGRVIGWHEARSDEAWKSAAAGWNKLKRRRGFWR